MKSISRFLMLILFIGALLAGLIFSGHNQTAVPLWLGTDFSAQPLSIWVIAAFISGGLAGLLLGLGLWQGRVSRKKVKQLQQRLLMAENELRKQKQSGNVSEMK
ncbi:MAG: lipopolysaccharide assembly protein LapA domain-containing protein [Pseudomonadota bacterium]